MKVESLAAFLKDKQCCAHGAHEHRTVVGDESRNAAGGATPCWDLAIEHQGRTLPLRAWCAACAAEEAASLPVVTLSFPSIARG